MSTRTAQYDVAVIGGGINGAGIARDAAGRGYSVLLCERDDLAAHTSSASTKLIHGGLRYLEHYEFRLVAKALAEREVLLAAAPHIIWPLRFVMPHAPGLRPSWMIRLGLLLYDRLGRRERLPGSEALRLDLHPAGGPLQPSLRHGFGYSDCWVQDARLVVLNAMDAAQRGATVLTRTACTEAERHDDHWRLRLRGGDGVTSSVTARYLINATGPWVGEFLAGAGIPSRHRVRLVKGSHIVVPRLFEHDDAYILQNRDGRIVFAIPYETHYTLVGTTDVPVQDDPAAAECSEQETVYLCDAINRYFARPIAPSDVVWSYSGVRPLLDDAEHDPAAVTRDYLLETDTRGAPVLSVFGGKITTYRVLAEDALQRIERALAPRGPRWTAAAVLPGGEVASPEHYAAALRERHPWLPPELAGRYARHYGSRTPVLLGDAAAVADLGRHFGAGLYQGEVEYLQRYEWAHCADDVLWRRTKLGLRCSAAQRAALDDWMSAATPGEASARAADRESR